MVRSVGSTQHVVMQLKKKARCVNNCTYCKPLILTIEKKSMGPKREITHYQHPKLTETHKHSRFNNNSQDGRISILLRESATELTCSPLGAFLLSTNCIHSLELASVPHLEWRKGAPRLEAESHSSPSKHSLSSTCGKK